MLTPKMRARWVRGALVGGCSAVVTVGAHAAGEGMPHGPSLIVAGLMCAIVWAVLAGATMIAAHLAAAVLLGVAITAVEHLYIVCVSLLCWLRMFDTMRQPASARLQRVVTRVHLVASVLRSPGLGMRAPP
ncbi:hypothetical protein MDOR_33950 [Mycolicibacterium doricum]|uniref:Uncharacterized protein n=1 Tax=Mycolicibacterium doricum TaxID=126673 RepID=A0A1X1T3C1_9MYCO|nr:hypothetical protein [Mycolicibacterium doricum]MCV7270011.1 hypothetical protein [Mycolicibacterium doricum]ORV38888.1 hypothetical protein AWC01_13620 [Mycolicibacterium doricum]BBZ09226.1 hypothetical protein MDOR_33950 [Mycolicibacterium doricum]